MSVIDVNAASWEENILQSNILTVVDFWHNSCPWCLRLNPIFDEVAEEYKDKIKFAKLNALETSENQEIAIRYGVMSTPTLVFFCAGRPVEEVIGFMPKDRLKTTLVDMLDRHMECINQSTELQV